MMLHSQVIQSVALHVSIGLLFLLLCDKEETAHWWSAAMAICNETQHWEFLIALCQVLLPQGKSIQPSVIRAYSESAFAAAFAMMLTNE